MSNPERHGGEQDFAKSVEHQKHSELIHKYEQKTLGTEAPQHNEVENARKEALDYALEEKQYKPHEQHETAPIRPSVASGAKLKQSFDKTMDRVRTDMPLPQKVFSKLIHNQAVEKASDIVGSTVARPDAILSGSACAFVLTTAIYFTARYYGFSLSGSKTAWEIAKLYTEDFFNNLAKLNVLEPTHIVNATDHIPEQIELVQKLEKKGYTYTIDDGVYFDTSKVADYGKLTGQDLTKLKEGARVEANTQKRNTTDFALWKFSPKNKKRDMEWESPWGKGFPGWHIECSAMSMKYLGETLDIHTGGIEHIPIHHTNEIAQSEAATGKPFVNYWLHGNHIMLEGVKISKSLHNGITPQQLIKQGFDEMDIRLLLLQSHYRTQSNFTMSGLQAAKQRRISLQAFADLRFQLKEGGELNESSFEQTRELIFEELRRDLHTPEALAALSDIVTAAETDLVGIDAKQEFIEFLEFLDRVLGLKLLDSKDIADEQKSLIAKREKARGNKDFAESDKLRGELASQGINLRDTSLGTIWSRA